MALDAAPIATQVAELLDELEARYPDAELGNAVIVVEVHTDDVNVVEHRAIHPSTAYAAGLVRELATRLEGSGRDHPDD